MPYLTRITIYPIKSLDGVDVSSARILPSGAIEHDRRFALVDAEGRGVIGKRTARVHPIRSQFKFSSMSLSLGDDARQYVLGDPSDQHAVLDHLSKALGLPIALVEAPDTGFPDDTEAPGPTVIAEATLSAIAGWFPGLDIEGIRRRFRANLEVGGVEPFWDDRLYAAKDTVVRFRIGDVEFEGTNPCQRCVVPTRSSTTGETIADFAKTFVDRRRATLPPWANADRFDHFYRVAINTRPRDPKGGTIRVGDPIEILDIVPR